MSDKYSNGLTTSNGNRIEIHDNNITVTVQRTFNFEINKFHKPMLLDLIENGYVQLRRPKYTNSMGMVDTLAHTAFENLEAIGVMQEDYDAWHRTGDLTDKAFAQSLYEYILEQEKQVV